MTSRVHISYIYICIYMLYGPTLGAGCCLLSVCVVRLTGCFEGCGHVCPEYHSR